MHIFIVQRIDLDFWSMRYIKIYIIIIIIPLPFAPPGTAGLITLGATATATTVPSWMGSSESESELMDPRTGAVLLL